MQDTNTTPATDRSIEIDAAARLWLNRYNATCAATKTFADERQHCGLEFIERCQRAGLNPMIEAVTAYPAYDDKAGVWKLVFIPALETLYKRAKMTGHLGGVRSFTRVREDKRIMVIAEVTRLVVYPPHLNVTPVERLFSAEGDVVEWTAQCGRSPFWKSNPSNQCMNAMERRALLRAFPDVLCDMSEWSDLDDAAPREEGDAPRSTGPAPKPSDDMGAAARAVLQGATAKPVTQAATQPTTQAVAAPTGPTAQQSTGPTAATPTAQPTGPTLDTELATVTAAAGLTSDDLVAFLTRWDGKTLATMGDADRSMLISRILPRKPATRAQFEELTILRDAYLALPHHAEDWDQLCKAATEKLEFPLPQWAPRLLLQSQAVAIMALAEGLVRAGA